MPRWMRLTVSPPIPISSSTPTTRPARLLLPDGVGEGDGRVGDEPPQQGFAVRRAPTRRTGKAAETSRRLAPPTQACWIPRGSATATPQSGPAGSQTPTSSHCSCSARGNGVVLCCAHDRLPQKSRAPARFPRHPDSVIRDERPIRHFIAKRPRCPLPCGGAGTGARHRVVGAAAPAAHSATGWGRVRWAVPRVARPPARRSR